MSTEKRPFVAMIKPVGSRCNMHCAYCYYLDKGKYSAHKKQSRMSRGLLEELIQKTVEASSGPVVSFVWHGGEPTLAGIEFYEKAVELQKKYLPEGWQAWNNLQTNGLLINKKWCSFLKENGFDVGLSIDGSESVHDANRRDLGGKSTFAKVKSAAELLKAAGIMPDILCTVNKATLQDVPGVFEALEALDCPWVQFIPIVVRLPDGSFAPESITPEEYGEFLTEMFDLWIRRGLGKFDIQIFAEMARIMAGGQASVCWMAPECGRAPIIEEDGSVYACDHFVDPAHRIGNLSEHALSELLDCPEQEAFGKSKKEGLTVHCKRCPWYKFCGGGCPKDRFALSPEGEEGHYYLCAGLEKLFAHAVPILEKIMEMSRKRMSSKQIMESLKLE